MTGKDKITKKVQGTKNAHATCQWYLEINIFGVHHCQTHREELQISIGDLEFDFTLGLADGVNDDDDDDVSHRRYHAIIAKVQQIQMPVS